MGRCRQRFAVRPTPGRRSLDAGAPISSPARRRSETTLGELEQPANQIPAPSRSTKTSTSRTALAANETEKSVRRRPLLVPRRAELSNGHDGLTRLLSWNRSSYAAGTRWRPDESSTPVPQRQPDRRRFGLVRLLLSWIAPAVRAPTRASRRRSWRACAVRPVGRRLSPPSGEFRHRNRDTATDCGDRIAGSARLDRVLVAA